MHVLFDIFATNITFIFNCYIFTLIKDIHRSGLDTSYEPRVFQFNVA